VLVALVLLAVAMLAVFRSLGVGTQTAEIAQVRMLAQWSAENRLMEIRLRREWPNIGEEQFDCSQLDTVLSCRQKVLATPNAGFRRVELQVLDTGQRQVARLVGFATLVR
jgi:general secretion pathway protein I